MVKFDKTWTKCLEYWATKHMMSKKQVNLLITNTHAESMEKDSPILPLLLRKDVLRKLMDSCGEINIIYIYRTNTALAFGYITR